MDKNKLLIKYHMPIFLAITFLQYIGANFAHPITPTLIVNLNLPAYMFGAAFAAMSFTNFLFSPFWGKMRDYFSLRKILFVGCVGYGIGQILFSIFKQVGTILFARCFSGFFVGAISVSTLVYVVDNSKPQDQGKNLASLAVVQALGTSVGFLIGGSFGVISIQGTFILQAITLITSGILYRTLTIEVREHQIEEIKPQTLIKEANPFKAFATSKIFMNQIFAVLFLSILFAFIGTNAFEQCFNYYIKDQFNLSSIYNGVLKAGTGILILLVNTLLFRWIVRKFDLLISTMVMLVSCALSIFLMITTGKLWLFLVLYFVFYIFNALYIPLIQDVIARRTKSNSNIVMGFYNAMKSLGMIIGALFAGFIYQFGPKVPFVMAIITFLVATLLIYAVKRMNHRFD